MSFLKKLTLALMATVLFCGFSCGKGTQRLATASDAIAHSLANAQTAAKQAVAQGVITQADDNVFEVYVSRVSQSGLVLDQGIRANESATTLSPKVNSFLDAFNALNTSGIAGIKNDNLKLALSTIITGAEASVSVIAAATGK